jgi:hypothetical protein
MGKEKEERLGLNVLGVGGRGTYVTHGVMSLKIQDRNQRREGNVTRGGRRDAHDSRTEEGTPGGGLEPVLCCYVEQVVWIWLYCLGLGDWGLR